MPPRPGGRWALYCAALLLAGAVGALAAEPEARQELEELKKRNATLEELVRQQQTLIDALNQRVTAIERGSGGSAKRFEEDEPAPKVPVESKSSNGFKLGNVHLSGEGGVAFFASGPNGQFPDSEFRVDEAKLFIETPIWGRVYFYTELNLAARDRTDLGLEVGELYLDWENFLGLRGDSQALNLRLGRLDIPFGEEYLTRDAIDNPLISHSLPDFWGVDEGLELYGSLGTFSYVLAVQNGGQPVAQDFDGDKAVVGRLGYDPAPWLHLSVSGMRTGDLDATNDKLSELWWGGGWFRSIGGAKATKFHANLVEGDVGLKWRSGHLKTFGGVAAYDDNNPQRSYARTMYFYSVEGQQQITRKFYAAARFSQIFANNGYPLVGQGDMGIYFFNYSPLALTTEIWRLGFGLGYRFNDHFLLKSEYTIERGNTRGGDPRDQEVLFSAEAAFKF